MGYDLLRKEGELPKLVGHRGACDVAPEIHWLHLHARITMVRMW